MEFAIFILSHGRADTMTSWNTLRECGYTGQIFVVIDTEDDQRDRYIENFGAENVKIFDKDDYIDTFDSFDNFRKKSAVIFARLASQDMAAKMGLKYYAQFDDDLDQMYFRWAEGETLKGCKVKSFDSVVAAMCEFMEVNENIAMLALGTQAMTIGGANGNFKRGLAWMGSCVFFLKTERHVPWCCTINEDNCTQIRLAMDGKMSFSLSSIVTMDKEFDGGMQAAYSDGKWQHNFARVLLAPSACYIGSKRLKNGQVKVVTKGERIFPKILSDKYKKGAKSKC